MRNEYTENWSKLCQCAAKPIIDLAELNVTTLSNLTKNTNSFEKFSTAKKPEEFLAAQMELLNNASVELTKYAQKACSIGLDAVSEGQKIWNDILRETTAKASDFAKQSNVASMKTKERE